MHECARLKEFGSSCLSGTVLRAPTVTCKAVITITRVRITFSKLVLSSTAPISPQINHVPQPPYMKQLHIVTAGFHFFNFPTLCPTQQPKVPYHDLRRTACCSLIQTLSRHPPHLLQQSNLQDMGLYWVITQPQHQQSCHNTTIKRSSSASEQRHPHKQRKYGTSFRPRRTSCRTCSPPHPAYCATAPRRACSRACRRGARGRCL